MIILSIDPGQTGAAVLARHGKTAQILDVVRFYVPEDRKDLKGRPKWNFEELAAFVQYHGCDVDKTVIEYVHAMPKQGVTSTFTFGTNYGITFGICAALGLRIDLVTPQVWKRHFGLLKTEKADAIAKAHEVYPMDTSRIDTSGVADAALLGAYFHNKLTGVAK